MSSGSFGFVWVHRFNRIRLGLAFAKVHSVSPRGRLVDLDSRVFTRVHQGVDGLIRVGLGFARAQLEVAVFIWVRLGSLGSA